MQVDRQTNSIAILFATVNVNFHLHISRRSA